MYQAIESITKLQRGRKASTGVIIRNRKEPPYFIVLKSYADFIHYQYISALNTCASFPREYAEQHFKCENLTRDARYFEQNRELHIPQLYY